MNMVGCPPLRFIARVAGLRPGVHAACIQRQSRCGRTSEVVYHLPIARVHGISLPEQRARPGSVDAQFSAPVANW